jgi:hypothetical protein
MKTGWLIVAGFAFCSLAIGCGGGSNTVSLSGHTATVNGVWDIVLGENQVNIATAPYGDVFKPTLGQTEIDISLVQSSGIITAQTNIAGKNMACMNTSTGGGFDGTNGGWSFGNFTFSEGSVVGQTVGFALGESIHPPRTRTGTLIFTGTVDSATTMHGTVTDGCMTTGQGATSTTWTATKIVALPTS